MKIYSFLNFTIIEEEICSSTNDILKKRRDDFKLFSVYVCNSQTKGKGRWGRKWFSFSEGGLYFSIKLPVKKTYNIIPELAVIRAFSELSFKTKFLWPNDVYYKGKKLCGILNESIYGIKSFTVSGIGINLNQTIDEFPEPLKKTATSYYIETKKRIDKKEFLKIVLKKFTELEKISYEKLLNEIKSYSMLKKGDDIIIKKRDDEFKIKFTGYDKDLNLCGINNNDKICFNSGEVIKIEI